MAETFLYDLHIQKGTKIEYEEKNMDLDSALDHYDAIYATVFSICCFGVIGNFISFLVLLRIQIRCSSYTYLTVLSVSDLGSCILLILTVTIHQTCDSLIDQWFGMIISLPLSAIFSCISVSATIGVTIDRLLLLWKPTRPCPPPFCKPEVARRVMAGAVMLAFFFNLPYFFIFNFRDDGDLGVTPFLTSEFYVVYNWIRFILYGLIPAIVLPISTGLLIASLMRVSNQLRHLSCKSQTVCETTRMTYTLIALVVFFMLGEIPGHMVSRKAAFIFFFSGDYNMPTSASLEIARQVVLILGAINCSINFFLYFMLHPPFGKGLKQLFSRKTVPKTSIQKLQVNVFVLSNNCDIKTVTQLLPTLSTLSEFVTIASR